MSGRWLVRGFYMPSELWSADPALRRMNDGWGSCNTGADAPGVCNLGGIGCNVNHVEVYRRNTTTAERSSPIFCSEGSCSGVSG